MEKKYVLVFDEVITKQLKKAAKDIHIKNILKNMLNKLELLGPYAGQLLDSHLQLHEVKNKQPPIRLYYKYNKNNEEIYVFEYEMKTSPKKQKKTISRIRLKA